MITVYTLQCFELSAILGALHELYDCRLQHCMKVVLPPICYALNFLDTAQEELEPGAVNYYNVWLSIEPRYSRNTKQLGEPSWWAECTNYAGHWYHCPAYPCIDEVLHHVLCSIHMSSLKKRLQKHRYAYHGGRNILHVIWPFTAEYTIVISCKRQINKKQQVYWNWFFSVPLRLFLSLQSRYSPNWLTSPASPGSSYLSSSWGSCSLSADCFPSIPRLRPYGNEMASRARHFLGWTTNDTEHIVCHTAEPQHVEGDSIQWTLISVKEISHLVSSDQLLQAACSSHTTRLPGV